MTRPSAEAHSSAAEATDLVPISVASDDGILQHGPVARNAGNSLPWLICAILTAALLASHWWSARQIDLLSRQLVATQDSFARISEGASADLVEISGQLKDNSSRVLLRQDSLQQQLHELLGRVDQAARRLEQQGMQLQEQDQQLLLLLEADRQQLIRLDSLQASLDETETLNQERFSRVDEHLQQAGIATETLAARTQALEQREDPSPRLTALDTQLSAQESRLAQIASSLESTRSTLEQKQKALEGTLGRYAGNESVGRLEDEIMVLRSAMDSKPAAPAPRAEVTRREFDAFRLQTTRHITTLQEQWRNLQRQQR